MESNLFVNVSIMMTIATSVLLLAVVPTTIFPFVYIGLLTCTMFGFERVGLGRLGNAIDNTLYNSVVRVCNFITLADNATWNITSKTLGMIANIMEHIAYPFEGSERQVARLLGMPSRNEREAKMIDAIVNSDPSTNPLDTIKWVIIIYISITLCSLVY